CVRDERGSGFDFW
nr:immunoglobulin heavy chain junction region [Macaca mulatta]MOX93748.1 immunoglobulin heavy chain junction region [Macaca mulatta]MOX93983.1 immunoglobulin heavy chain junction region [Macaca mulatta]MOX94325.1 immunoglobulin heavy chain junction region [Macaca mulatta]MOX94904.1 immunoglobulin heavy chain junction region [Macaca mulatta]